MRGADLTPGRGNRIEGFMELREAFDHLYSTYFGERQHERLEIENLPRLLQGCDCFIDVGASLGMYTYFANQSLRNSTIIAVEADPDRYDELAKNCEKWAEGSTNKLIPVHAALGDSRGTARFFKTGTQISGGFFPVTERAEVFHEVEVPMMLLDDLFSDDNRQTLVKIDVEGAELRVLRGSAKHLDSGRTRFLIEMHWWGDRERGTTSIDVLRFLYSHGLAIEKSVRVHTSNYYVFPAPERARIWAYLRVAPLLAAKSLYGRFVPASIRNWRERRLNRRRARVHGRPGEN
jgi:FkbM family methyltransferase